MEIENQFRKGDDPETVHGKLGRTPGRSQAGGMQDGASRVSQEGAQGTAVPRGTKTLDAQRLCVCRWARPQYAGGKGGGIFFFFLCFPHLYQLHCYCSCQKSRREFPLWRRGK